MGGDWSDERILNCESVKLSCSRCTAPVALTREDTADRTIGLDAEEVLELRRGYCGVEAKEG